LHSSARFIALLLMSLAITPVTASEVLERNPREFFFTPSFGDLPEELSTAKQQGKKGVVLFFEMEGCPYCQRMLENVLNRSDVQDWYSERFLSIAIDIKGDVEVTDFDGITLPSKVFAEQRRAVITPVITFLDLNGNEIYRHWGMIANAETFLLLGKYIIEGQNLEVEFNAYLSKMGNEPESAVLGTQVK
jgi:thioredoxin-related protein